MLNKLNNIEKYNVSYKGVVYAFLPYLYFDKMQIPLGRIVSLFLLYVKFV